MYEIRLCDDKYGVVNSDGDILCVFRLLNVAADFVAYIQGGKLTETEKYHIDEAVRQYHTATKRG